ncbi:hypothetical protein HZP54_11995 [Elizabethkingia anophelis]|nr:hypothetical protein [Elizabethkingia anophelis]MCT4233698.1 hypothetical protein [Elizabethkingia anophelis]
MKPLTRTITGVVFLIIFLTLYFQGSDNTLYSFLEGLSGAIGIIFVTRGLYELYRAKNIK